MSVEGRELGWDDSIKQDSQNFDPIPEGDYNVTIEKYDRSRSKGEGKLPPCNMAVVYFIVHGQDREITIRENYILHSSLEWKLSELFRGVGLKKEGESSEWDWNSLPGKRQDQKSAWNRESKIQIRSSITSKSCIRKTRISQHLRQGDFKWN